MSELRVPQLRFSEFSGEWEEKKLGDIYKNLKTGSTPSRLVKDYFTGENLWITSGELNYGFIDDTIEKISDKAIKDTNLRLYPSGTFFIAITGLEAPGTRGKCAINSLPATTNQSCMAFYEVEELSTKFLFFWYKKYGILLYFKYAQGTKQQSFNNKIVEKFDINLPSKLEQEKIASFLTSVDTKIEQLTKKAKLLGEYKKGVMQKIFSQKIRFRADDGSDYPEWEEKKLGEIVVINRGKHVQSVKDGNKILLGMGAVTEDGKLVTKHNINSEHEYLVTGNLVMPERDIGVGLIIGKVALIDKNDTYVLGANLLSLKVYNNYASLFIYHLINSANTRKKIKRLVSGSAQLMITSKDIKKVNISIPSLPEQTKIANFLSSIDRKIDQVSKQLDSTKEFKKALLQQMFV